MSTSRPGAKGLLLEETLRQYFHQAGYFAVRSVPYKLEGEDVTDVDLWLYERPTGATRRRHIVDVKNKKNPKASERVIWVKGLQQALGVDGAFVATTDRRAATKRLARQLHVTLLDGEAISKITQSTALQSSPMLSSDDFEAQLKVIDLERRGGEWRAHFAGAKSSLLTGMGVQATNKALSSVRFFSEQATFAHPGSVQAVAATRACYACASYATIALDFVLSDLAFRSPAERRNAVAEVIRFGNSETRSTLATVRAAIALTRKYAINGNAVAAQVESAFFAEAEQIPAEIVSDFVTRGSTTDALFVVSRELITYAFERNVPCFDVLTRDSRSILGIFLDFAGVSRQRFADASPRMGPAAGPIDAESPSLFGNHTDSGKPGE